MYAEVFGIDVPLIQLPSTESTQGTHRTPSALRSPTPKVDASESSVPTQSTVIRLRLSQWKSIRLTLPAPVLTVDKADELILQDTLQVSLAEHKSRQEQEAKENVALVDEHLASVEIEKMVEGQENVADDRLIPRNDEHNIPGTRLEPRSDKESLEVGITDVIVYVNVYDEEEEEDEITDEARFMPQKSFGSLANHLYDAMAESLPVMVDKHVKEQVEQQVPEQVQNQVLVYVAEGLLLERLRTKEEMEKMIAKAILQERGNIQAQISSQIQQAIINNIPSQVDASIRSYLSGHILHVHPVPQTTCRTSAIRPRDQDDPHDDAHPKGENSAKRQKTSEYKAFVSGEPSSGQDNEQEQDDDEIPTKQVSQDIMEEVSLNVDEAKLKKIVDEMLRQRYTSGDEHQYHIDLMKNFLKSNIV
nr:hypothetical protein [Tanacetum cinerariifolium]